MGSREDENKSMLPSGPAFGSKAASYSSTTSSKPSCSCAPCERAAGGSFVTCPTCQGSGEIPRELEKQLVALIPYGDQRLKPRHTKLSVFLAVFICLVTSSLIVFFLFPRTIAVQPVGLNSSTVTVGEADVHLNITNILSISNNNYYPIAVTQLTIEVLHLSLVVGQVSDSLLLHIGPLASEQGHPDLFLPEPFRAAGLPELRICGLPGKRIQAPLAGPSPAVTCLLSSSPRAPAGLVCTSHHSMAPNRTREEITRDSQLASPARVDQEGLAFEVEMLLGGRKTGLLI
ncbi:hypothetical protein EI555_013964 [Monodon monoceros]|uniref:Transmembrane protein 106A n=1 Tax=Monodon monoceros TaxID=40151 RepID=A0A4U1F5B3_MONMO|nr:hypothetical protein EI555_013964 [Monodon monoceros]